MRERVRDNGQGDKGVNVRKGDAGEGTHGQQGKETTGEGMTVEGMQWATGESGSQDDRGRGTRGLRNTGRGTTREEGRGEETMGERGRRREHNSAEGTMGERTRRRGDDGERGRADARGDGGGGMMGEGGESTRG